MAGMGRSIRPARVRSFRSVGVCLSGRRRGGRPVYAAAADNKEGDTKRGNNSKKGSDIDEAWTEKNLSQAFPAYLQSQEYEEFCEPRGSYGGEDIGSDKLWETMRREAQECAAKEPILSSFMYASILAHKSFEQALSFVLANRLHDATLLPTQLNEIFMKVLSATPEIRNAARGDIIATHERDPACRCYIDALLYFKGYQSIQCQRIAHNLWEGGSKVIPQMLQSRMSEVYAVDIHPAATFGSGILLDHATGVVIGETARVGDNCSIMQGVTLGGTGKETGDRHPKISKGVLIGAHATILGNIRIGRGAMVAAGSLVLKDVPDFTMVAGSPAQGIGKVRGPLPSSTMQQLWSGTSKTNFCEAWEAAVRDQAEALDSSEL